MNSTTKSILKWGGRIGAVAAAPFTGGLSLGAIPVLDAGINSIKDDMVSKTTYKYSPINDEDRFGNIKPESTSFTEINKEQSDFAKATETALPFVDAGISAFSMSPKTMGNLGKTLAGNSYKGFDAYKLTNQDLNNSITGIKTRLDNFGTTVSGGYKASKNWLVDYWSNTQNKQQTII